MTSNYPHLREAQRIVWRKDCALSTNARHVFVYLLNRMNEDYTNAYPSIARMVDDLGMGRDSVIRYTEEVVNSRLLEREAKPGCRGRYTYRVASLEALVQLLDKKLEEWAKEFWASQPAIGRQDRPVGDVDRSGEPTGTGRQDRLVPVDNVDTERLPVKTQVKAKYSTPTPPHTPTKPQTAASTLFPKNPEGGAELHMPAISGCDVAPDIPWIDPAKLPPRYAQAVYFDAAIGKLYLTDNERGVAFYNSLRSEPYDIAAIKAGISNAGARAPTAAARRGGLEALVRSYCGYAQQKNPAAGGASQAPPWATFKGGAFQP